jgi:acyl dehydratase
MNLDKRGNFKYEDLQVGTQFSQEYVITPDVHRRFLDLFGDVNPLHVDDAVAISCGFPAKLVHGAILNGFISNFVGMNFPGRRTMVLGVDIRFIKTTHVGDVLTLEAVVKERLESRQVAMLQYRFLREATVVANGRVNVMIVNL